MMLRCWLIAVSSVAVTAFYMNKACGNGRLVTFINDFSRQEAPPRYRHVHQKDYQNLRTSTALQAFSLETASFIITSAQDSLAQLQGYRPHPPDVLVWFVILFGSFTLQQKLLRFLSTW